MNNNSYNTLSEAVKELKLRGFDEELELINKDEIKLGGEKHNSSDIIIDEFHRFEGMSNPADMSVVYAIESTKDSSKGIYVDSFGAKSSQEFASFIKNVPEKSE